MIKFSLAQDNYWLIQYQKLLDAKPKGLQEAERAVDAKVKEILEAAGAKENVKTGGQRLSRLDRLEQYRKEKLAAKEKLRKKTPVVPFR